MLSKHSGNDRADREYYIERYSRSEDERGMLYFKPPRSAGSAAEGAGAGAFVSVAPFVITLAPNTSFITIEGVRLEHSRSTAVAQPAGRTDPNF